MGLGRRECPSQYVLKLRLGRIACIDARRLCGSTRPPPDYITEKGRPKKPQDLVGHDCIKRRFSGGTFATWRFSDRAEEIEISPEGRLTDTSAHNELQAALALRGIAHIFDGYANVHIRSGRPMGLLAEWSPVLPHWFLCHPSRRLPSAAMRAFLDYMRNYDWDAGD
ncbi:hypothetical protein FMN50_00740 [Rhodobacterales bacterium]|nr:hypothetical protein FMN50_00740 [Rhodobacterales bacterium]